MLLIFLLLMLVIIGLASGKLRINIKKIELCNINKKLSFEYDIVIQIIVFRFIRVYSLKLNHKQAKNMIKSLTKQKLDINKFDLKNQLEVIKKSKIQVKSINISIDVGTENTAFTVYIVTIISSVIPIIFRNFNINYMVNPIYNMGNKIKLVAEGITEIKFVHIIYAIYILVKGRGKEYGRGKWKKTPNRRPYDYSNE